MKKALRWTFTFRFSWFLVIALIALMAFVHNTIFFFLGAVLAGILDKWGHDSF